MKPTCPYCKKYGLSEEHCWTKQLDEGTHEVQERFSKGSSPQQPAYNKASPKYNHKEIVSR